jgi:peptide/nickel transport system ATP-binding protein
MLDVKNLSIEFSQYDRKWKKQSVRPVRDLSLNIQTGEIVAVIGSSGSGKSLLAHAILGLLPHNAKLNGEILFKNEQLDDRRIRTLRGKEISLIPQSVAYLNPLARVGKQVFRAARLSGKCSCTASESTNKAFSRYKLQDTVKSLFPFQVSGGMARRVLTATATAGDASLLIADEPTTGLDPRVAKQSLSHLRELADSGKSVMLISHDLDAVLDIADRVAVIYAGTTVEVVQAANFKDNGALMHPYTRALWSALPQQEFTFLKGNQPKDFEAIEGCIFHSRCPQGTEQCRTAEQPLRSVGANQVRCCRA